MTSRPAVITVVFIVLILVGVGAAGNAPKNPTVGESLPTLVLIAACYFLPTFVAFARKHQSVLGVGLVNALFGWTGIGWVTAFIWACSGSAAAQPVVIPHQQPAAPPPLPATPRIEQDLSALARLRDGGLITDAEYTDRRVRILDSLG